MSALTYIATTALPGALWWIGERQSTPEARAMVLAIGLQESEFIFRRQKENGPARGFFGFEEAGVRGVLTHKASKPLIMPILDVMGYRTNLPNVTEIHDALTDNDVLACAFARLLLWTHSNPLPTADQATKGWMQYIQCWRPGKPRQSTWEGNFNKAWSLVNGGNA